MEYLQTFLSEQLKREQADKQLCADHELAQRTLNGYELQTQATKHQAELQRQRDAEIAKAAQRAEEAKVAQREEARRAHQNRQAMKDAECVKWHQSVMCDV